MDLSVAQMYTVAYFASMVGLIVFLAIMLGFIMLIIRLYYNLMTSIFGKEEEKEYD